MIMIESHQIDVYQRAMNERKLKEVEATTGTNVSMHYASPHGQAIWIWLCVTGQSPNICANETKKHLNEVNAMCETTEQTVTKAGQGHEMKSHLQRKNIQIIIDTLFSSGSYHFLTADIKDPIKVFRFNYQKRPHISHKVPYLFQFFYMDFLQIYKSI